MTTRVTALLATFQRVDTTLACLERLEAQVGHDAELTAVLMDASSPDGTAERVRQAFPWVVVDDAGTGVFWNQGMRMAWIRGREELQPDHYLWLNDDTQLDPDALARLLDTERRIRRDHGPSVVAGATRDPVTGKVTYGGVVRPDPRRPLHFERVPMADHPVRVEATNGNVVLVPADVAERVGNLDPGYSHHLGDFDYGLRAGRKGLGVWVAPGTVGTCGRNRARPHDGVGDEIRHLASPKGLPVHEWRRFAMRWAGPFWPVYFASPYLRRLVAAARRG